MYCKDVTAARLISLAVASPIGGQTAFLDQNWKQETSFPSGSNVRDR
jgi:hypothetical protein